MEQKYKHIINLLESSTNKEVGGSLLKSFNPKELKEFFKFYISSKSFKHIKDNHQECYRNTEWFYIPTKDFKIVQISITHNYTIGFGDDDNPYKSLRYNYKNHHSLTDCIHIHYSPKPSKNNYTNHKITPTKKKEYRNRCKYFDKVYSLFFKWINIKNKSDALVKIFYYFSTH